MADTSITWEHTTVSETTFSVNDTDTTVLADRSTDSTLIGEVTETTVVADLSTHSTLIGDVTETTVVADLSTHSTLIGDVTETTVVADLSTHAIVIDDVTEATLFADLPTRFLYAIILVCCCVVITLIVVLVVSWAMRKKRSYDVMAKHSCTVSYKDDTRPIGGSGENMARRSLAYDECDLVPIDEILTPCFTVDGEWLHATAERGTSDMSHGIINWTSQNQNYMP